MQRAEKWLWLIVIIILIFLIWVSFLATSAKGQEKLFFSEWKTRSVLPTQHGYFQIIVDNPDENGNIKSVIVAYVPQQGVIAYWYFDKFGNPFLYEMEDGRYSRNTEKEKSCIQCHRGKTTPL